MLVLKGESWQLTRELTCPRLTGSGAKLKWSAIKLKTREREKVPPLLLIVFFTSLSSPGSPPQYMNAWNRFISRRGLHIGGSFSSYFFLVQENASTSTRITTIN